MGSFPSFDGDDTQCIIHLSNLSFPASSGFGKNHETNSMIKILFSSISTWLVVAYMSLLTGSDGGQFLSCRFVGFSSLVSKSFLKGGKLSPYR